MPAKRRRPTRRRADIAPLQNLLILHHFVCRAFGYDDMRAMLDLLRDVPPTVGAGGESAYARTLYTARATVGWDDFAQYDANITEHSRRLRMTGEHGRTWKPHQYLALLFTEHYLHHYFDDSETLRADLNRAKRNADGPIRSLPDYKPDDLRTIAFQSATGSGKTLIMHAHVLQYRHYLNRAGKKLNNVILLTPNEQMSAQHERELLESGLHARLFSSETGTDLFAPVEILDLNKLAEKKGVKRVAVGDFGESNLVLVDEGHLGASGKVWRERRMELARGGFAFEYSATFNQVVARDKDKDLRNAYGKCLLFDYAYRQFHTDGYGKDYAILNLPGGVQDENSRMYLLGCLLTFYQQCRIWKDKAADWAEFNPAKPLWVFLGKTVTGSSEDVRETKADVVRILDFLGWVMAHGDDVRAMIARLRAGQSGLTDGDGHDYFVGRFGLLPPNVGNLYADVCDTLFHGSGRMHVAYLTAGEGELHLRSADRPVFGVVNIGDSAALYKLLGEHANPDFDVERETGFAERLFAGVDRPDSPVNIVVGARRFIAGWNSWRVSTMGLMHVGVGEGPEVIQMFGRGVRLKGWKMSLKRHGKSGAESPADSAALTELETLYIFGLRANYMQTFREMLATEGMTEETVRLPVTWNFGRKTDLKFIRLPEGLKYERSDGRPMLPHPGEKGVPAVTLDLYSSLQAVASTDHEIGEETPRKTPVKLDGHVGFFNRTRIYDKLLVRKRQQGWSNLHIAPKIVDSLLENHHWYTLYLPPERLRATSFRQVRELEAIATVLITEYIDRCWRGQRRSWESQRYAVVTLDEDDPNRVEAYALSADAKETQLVKDIHEMEKRVRKGEAGNFPHLKLGVLKTRRHAYEPLLYADKDCKITIQPVALNENEKKIVEKLAELAEANDACLQGRELFLIRNLTRGRGVSFFDDHGYYPDFIVWLKDGDCQHILFLDPKGLGRFGPKERKKVRLHREIKEIETQIRTHDPNLRLHAYVLSVTSRDEISDAEYPPEQWAERGVYFLNEPDGLRQVISDALRTAPAT